MVIVLEPGETMTYSLNRLQERGVLFVGPQMPTYAGMIIGEHSRENDLVVNPNINKKFTNVRSSGTDEKIFLTPPRELTLEDALAYIEDDELIEITPQNLRLRKRWLDHNMRKRMDKEAKAAV